MPRSFIAAYTVAAVQALCLFIRLNSYDDAASSQNKISRKSTLRFKYFGHNPKGFFVNSLILSFHSYIHTIILDVTNNRHLLRSFFFIYFPEKLVKIRNSSSTYKFIFEKIVFVEIVRCFYQLFDFYTVNLALTVNP